MLKFHLLSIVMSVLSCSTVLSAEKKLKGEIKMFEKFGRRMIKYYPQEVR